MKDKLNQFSIKFIKKTNIFVWILFLLFGITAFSYKLVIPVTLGVMFISMSFIFFPWLNKITGKYNFKLSFLNKLIIFITSFLATSYTIKINDKSYIVSVVVLILNIVIWLLVILFNKRKSKSLKK